jgi:hypothetical protein
MLRGMAATLCPLCGKEYRRLDRHLARHAGTGTTAAALRALQQSPPPGMREPHTCATPGGCLLGLEIGVGPRSLREAEARGEPAKLAGGLDLAFGGAAAAESAWRAHREELAAFARADLDKARAKGWALPDQRPLALDVFEPGAPWPPAAESEPA